VHAAAFLVLLGSGLCLYLPSLAELVGRRPLLKSIHIYTAVAWAVAIVVVVAFGDRRALRATVRELDRLDSSRLNVGQKLNAIATAAFAILFGVSGLFLWYGERDTRFRLPGALLVHDWLMDVSLVLFAGHLFLSLIYPRTRHALSGMTRGWVDEDWARTHHPEWAAEAQVGRMRGSRNPEAMSIMRLNTITHTVENTTMPVINGRSARP
jgi:formate dehydrogenase subunit gamma